jgi:hypothetical protein
MAKPGRNEPCPCGSGKKYKNCHESKTANSRTSYILMVVVGAAVVAAIAAGVASFTGEGSRSATRALSRRERRPGALKILRTTV